MDGHFPTHFIGVLGGLGAIGLGYILSKVSDWTDEQTEQLKQHPKYYSFAKLGKDLGNTDGGYLRNVFVEGVVSRETIHGVGALKGYGGVKGPAKLVKTSHYSKVYNGEKQIWEDRSNTMVNQRISVPFQFVDNSGNAITVENIHDTSNFVSILSLVHQTKSVPEQRSIGDHATNLMLREIPNGSLTKEYLLLYGSRFAALGDALQKDYEGSGGGSNIVFIPNQVASSINYLISRREFIAKVEKLVSNILLVGGTALSLIELYMLFNKRKNNQLY